MEWKQPLIEFSFFFEASMIEVKHNEPAQEQKPKEQIGRNPEKPTSLP